MSIQLDKEDILKIWELNGDIDDDSPLHRITEFITPYKKLNPFVTIPYTFEFKIFLNKSHIRGGLKIDILNEFAAFFDKKINIDEIFILLLNSLPKKTKNSSMTQIFKYLDLKYPEYFKEVTEAMDKSNIIKYHQDNVVNSWLILAKDKKATFKGQEIFNFIKNVIYEKDSTLSRKIIFLNNFDKEKVIPILDSILDAYDNNPIIIDAIHQYNQMNNIATEKKEIPIFNSTEKHLFHYEMEFKPEGVMQKLNIKLKEARKVSIWISYFLAEHLCPVVSRKRLIGNEIHYNYEKKISLKISTPYESAFNEAKITYSEALDVFFNSDFLTKERMAVIQLDEYNEILAKEFKAFIKPAKLKQELCDKLQVKNDKILKIKI